MSDTIRILCVDDEEAVLDGLRRSLKRTGFECIATTSQEEALRIAGEVEITVVVTDYKMPGMNGAEFLDRLRRIAPNARRVLLSGEADAESIMRSVNQGAIHKVLTKPVARDELVLALEEMVEIYRLQQDNSRLSDELAQSNQALRAINEDLSRQVDIKVDELFDARRLDSLTFLPNRQAILEYLTAQAAGEAGDTALMVACLGIRGLGRINETFGLKAGDAVLAEVARRLQVSKLHDEFVGRLGGDQFCVVSRHYSDLGSARRRLQAIIDSISGEYRIEAHPVLVTANAGVSLDTTRPLDGERLLHNAEVARNSAGPGIGIHDPDAGRIIAEGLKLEFDLRHALDRDQFELHYQPRVDAASGRVLAVEGLLRWHREPGKMVSPGLFVPLLEQTGLIVPVGEWVIAEGLRALERFHAAGHHRMGVSVNVSRAQLNDASVVAQLKHWLTTSPNRHLARYFEIEVTESALAQDEALCRTVLREIEDLGFGIALDDFGTGYSALSTLMQYPIDTLKIDRSFVINLGTSDTAGAVVRAIISLGRSLGMRLVAEGVETEAQSHLLNDLGCDQLQGFYFSKPIPESQLMTVLSASAATSIA